MTPQQKEEMTVQTKPLDQKALEILIEGNVLVEKLKLLEPREYPRGDGLAKYVDHPAFAIWAKSGTNYAAVYGCGLFQIIE